MIELFAWVNKIEEQRFRRNPRSCGNNGARPLVFLRSPVLKTMMLLR